LVLESSDGFLKGLALALKASVTVNFGAEGTITDLPEGFLYVIIPHIVSVEESKDVSGDERRRDVHVDYRCRMNLAVVGGSVKG
jgi:hypothetical protein